MNRRSFRSTSASIGPIIARAAKKGPPIDSGFSGNKKKVEKNKVKLWARGGRGGPQVPRPDLGWPLGLPWAAAATEPGKKKKKGGWFCFVKFGTLWGQGGGKGKGKGPQKMRDVWAPAACGPSVGVVLKQTSWGWSRSWMARRRIYAAVLSTPCSPFGFRPMALSVRKTLGGPEVRPITLKSQARGK